MPSRLLVLVLFSTVCLAFLQSPTHQAVPVPALPPNAIHAAGPPSMWNYTTGASQLFGPSTVIDLDGDGYTEVVFSDGSIPRNKVWCLNGQNGTVKWNTTLPVSGEITSHAVCDVDIDGQYEVLVADYMDSLIFCLNSDGSVRYSRPFTTGHWGHGYAVCDVDNDGAKEILGIGNDGNITCRAASNGAYEWSYIAVSSVQSLGRLVVGDVDLDGQMDMVFGWCSVSESKITCVSLMSRDVKWSMNCSRFPDSFVQLLIADVDANMKQEVIVTVLGVAYCLNGENGTIKWSHNSGVSFSRGYCNAADIDRDGGIEVIITGPTIACIKGTNGQVEWEAGTNSSTPSPLGAPVIGDVDGDADFELLVLAGTGAENTGLYCYSGSTGVSEWFIWTNTLEQICVPGLGDLDGDGLMDIVTCSENANVYAFKGSGPAWRMPGIVSCTGGSPLLDYCFIDSDADGLLDSLEEHLHLNVTNPDTDGDGLSDYQEIIDNTNPFGDSFYITHPLDVTYTTSSPYDNISWSLFSSNTSAPVYSVFCNDNLIANGSWFPGVPVTVYLENLDEGVFNYTIVAFDGLGGRIQDTVIITVYLGGIDTLPPPPPFQFELVIVTMGIIAVAVVAAFIVALIVRRRSKVAEKRHRPGARPSRPRPEGEQVKEVAYQTAEGRRREEMLGVQPAIAKLEPAPVVMVKAAPRPSFCSRCGNALPQSVEDIKFCVYCGESLGDNGKHGIDSK